MIKSIANMQMYAVPKFLCTYAHLGNNGFVIYAGEYTLTRNRGMPVFCE